MNKAKTKILLASLLMIGLLTVPTAYAAVYDDQWLIDNAIDGVKTQHPEHADKTFTGTVTSDWINTGNGWHKYVTLTATYGYNGLVTWKGRSYRGNRIVTTYYHDKAPVKETKQHHYKTTWKNPQYRKFWDGDQWIDNPNTKMFWVGERFWVVYPKP